MSTTQPLIKVPTTTLIMDCGIDDENKDIYPRYVQEFYQANINVTLRDARRYRRPLLNAETTINILQEEFEDKGNARRILEQSPKALELLEKGSDWDQVVREASTQLSNIEALVAAAANANDGIPELCQWLKHWTHPKYGLVRIGNHLSGYDFSKRRPRTALSCYQETRDRLGAFADQLRLDSMDETINFLMNEYEKRHPLQR